MQNLFSDILRFEITVKPEIERSIATFASGGGQTDEILVYIDAYYEDLQYEPPVGGSNTIPLGMTILVLKFPEWLANEEFRKTYDTLTGTFEKLGLQTEGSVLREVKHYFNLEKAALTREAIKKLDASYDKAKSLFEKKSEEKK